MPHLNTNPFEAKPVLTHRPTPCEFTQSRQIVRGAILALGVCLTACSSDTTDSTDPLDDGGETVSTTTSSVTTTGFPSTTATTSTTSTTSTSAGNSTTSGGPTTGSVGSTTTSTTGTGTTAGVGGDGAGGTTGDVSSTTSASSSSAGGMGGTGTSGPGGTEGTTSTSSTTGGGSCEIGMTVGSEVLMIGESFIAATHEITHEIERQARANGSLDENESYRDNSISGTTLAGGGNSIPNQYQNGVNQGPVKYVLMDGGGNDCLQANNPDGALSAAEGLFQAMAENGTEKIVYFFYPDPIGSQFNSLKSCLDTLRPQMKAMCDGLTSPTCYWLDLRDTWNGHGEYTQDGIHPTTAGSVATGQAIWDVMVENCVAQ